MLPPAWLSVIRETVAPPKRRNRTMVSPALLVELKETVPFRWPVELEPRALRTRTGTPLATESVVLPEIVPETASILVDPLPTAIARPVLLIVATVMEEEFHVAVLVRFCVVPSLKVPVAVNCSVFPMAIEGFAGVTAMDANVAGVTVSVVLPETEPEVA